MLSSNMKLKRAQSVQCKLPVAVEARHRKLSSRKHYGSHYDLPYHGSPYWIPTPYTHDQQFVYPISTFSLGTNVSVCPSTLNTSSASDINRHARRASHIQGSVESMKSAHQLKDTLVNAKKKTAEISIPGVKNVVEDRAHVGRKILWFMVLVVCACIAFIQVHDRVMHYLSTPVTVTFRIARNDSLKFPLVTICNRNYHNFTSLKILKEKNRNDSRPKKNDTDQVDFPDFISESEDIKQFWEFANLDIENQINECWFGRNITCKQVGQWKKVHTYEDNEHVTTTGLFNNLYVKLILPVADMNPSPDDGWRFLVHDRADVPMLSIRTHGSSIMYGANKDVRLYTRSFQTLNTKSRPCNGDPKYSVTRCTAECFIDSVVQNSTCRLSYMDLDSTTRLQPGFCNKPENHRHTSKVAISALFYGQWTSTHCNCTRQCNEDIFVPHTETSPGKDSSRLRIYFQDWTFDEVKEEHGYSFIALLCDVGGSLGLLLGASVLTFFEILEVIFGVMVGLVRRCFHRCRSN